VKVTGLVRFDVENPQLRLAFFDDKDLAERIKRVKGLEQIEQFLMPRNASTAARNLTLEIPILIKVAQPVRPLWMLALMGVVLVGAAGGGLLALSGQSAFRLHTPEGEKIVKLRPIASLPLTLRDEQCGELVRRFGAFTVRVHAPYVLESGAQRQRLGDLNGSFVVTNSDDNRAWNFSIESLARGEKSEPTGGSDLFVS
jgi:hypothetical protein